jgi:predicted Rossmann-fold nucleotide-binding protein
MIENQKTITIFGTSNASPEDEIFQLAERIGHILAENGFTIANGGYGGTMLAAAKAKRKKASQAGIIIKKCYLEPKSHNK